MNKRDVIDFLEQFNIEEDKINKFFKDKYVITINNNTFLTKKNFQKNQVYGDTLLFIQLKKHIPSKFLLDFIKKHTNLVEITTDKQALNFTYGKNIKIQSVKYRNFKENQLYIVTYQDEILGFARFENKEFINLMNIGEYLQEN